MPHATTTDTEYKHIQVKQLGATFVAEVTGVDFSRPVEKEVFDEIYRAIVAYGVLIFRHASLDDARHVAFSALFGDLDDIKPYIALGRKNRFAFDELFDVSNLEDDGSLVKIGSKRHHMGLGNGIFHVDSSFNPRRAGFSLLRAHSLPPKGHGGNTDFADTRTAFEELPEDLKNDLVQNEYIGAHSIMHSRRKAAPVDSTWLKDINPEDYPFGRHSVVQTHAPSGRQNMYIANHIHHLEYRTPRSKDFLIEKLLAHATQQKYVYSVEWENEGDLVLWDNTGVMHKAGQGTFMEKFARDMRRCTVHDGGKDAWGFNEKSSVRMGLP
ncbi:alpha-ketoglutarate-dependent 2,4-dichlorophenoxyacetate dioxygenase [Exophiala aquamarina CBS 119918]|uniref:Alpha-ketoglutarate-dependent 2,4-dichlorophenoxyacetate dioxygenase n=1 Tax=Exophiala aquamarina CBS 119918 TaxID=1182545 RepID=A0A072PJ87_9EURO|nr:alpha-ketoglutarate-dependent 2,4-dichlorophenoxyacetate dioxygenase [Exophiala aquamarina CBS 119918]KEF59368.1 alpha-ketoglutarate-dependent 2,4-dichlorophenoxyacetate dioxygenase [Exophiala aquamarina CBS 119918]